MSLVVDIQKDFGGFRLNVQFEAKRASWAFWALRAAARA